MANQQVPSTHRFRWEIQGLRALAVLLVIADHLRGWPTGGYIGVDVFFVVSGYVITGLLLREREASGRISLVKFYRRRVKRIMPAALVVLLATVAAGSVLLTPASSAQLNADAGWAAAFAANWRFISLGTDYMHAADAVSALQHYWSLSVEEQFYFVWPLLVIAVFAMSKRWVRLRRMIFAAVAAVIIVLSALWALHESVANPTSAYFSTFTRAWELGLGGLAAAAAPLTRRIPTAAQTPLAWLGLIGISFAAFRLDSNSVFPAPGAFLPTLSAAAILIAGERGPVADIYPLTNRAARYVGDISYSLYLWHFPVLTFLTVLFPARGIKYMALCVILIAALSVLSYHFVEDPLRRHKWRWWRRSTPVPRSRGRWALPALGALLVIVVTCCGLAVNGRERFAATPMNLTALHLNVAAGRSAADARRTALVSSALTAQSWPNLQPAVMNPGVDAVAPEWSKDGCLGDEVGAERDPFKNALRCVYGNPAAKQTIALVGDSHAISYLPGIRKALGDRWRIEVYTLEECPAVWVKVNRGDGAPHTDCIAFHQEVEAHLKAEHPNVIFMTSSVVSLTALTSHAIDAAADTEWRDGATAAIRALSKDTDKLLLIDDPPPGASLRNCYTPLNTPKDCVANVNAYYLRMVEAQSAAVATVHSPRVSYPSSLPWFCSRQGLCPSFVGTTPVTVDGFHVTAAEARELAPLLAIAIEEKRNVSVAAR